MAIAEAGSLSYRIPQGNQRFIQPPAPVEPLAPTQGEAMLPPLNEDLAQVQGLTDRYYDSYGKLKSFVEGMNSSGIDVTKPHYGDPAKMELFNTYKLLEANLITTSQQLKEQQRQRKMLDPLAARGEFVYTQNPDEELLQQGQAGYSTKLDPGVQQAMRILSENPLTPEDAKNQTTYFNNVNKQLQDRIDSTQDVNEKRRAQYQKDQLTQAYQQTKLFAPRGGAGGEAIQTKRSGAEAIVRQFTFAKHGIDGFDDVEVLSDGSAVGVNPSYSGWAMKDGRAMPKGVKSPITIKRTIKDFIRKGDKTYIRFEPSPMLKSNGEIDENREPIQPENVELTNRNVGQVLAEIFNANKEKIGVPYNEFLGHLKQSGLLKPGSENVDEDKIIGDAKPSSKIDDSVLKADLSSILKGVKDRIIITRDIPEIGKLRIQPSTEGFFVRDKVWEISVDGDVKLVAKSPEEVQNWIISNRILNHLISIGEKQTTTSKSEIDSDI